MVERAARQRHVCVGTARARAVEGAVADLERAAVAFLGLGARVDRLWRRRRRMVGATRERGRVRNDDARTADRVIVDLERARVPELGLGARVDRDLRRW